MILISEHDPILTQIAGSGIRAIVAYLFNSVLCLHLHPDNTSCISTRLISTDILFEGGCKELPCMEGTNKNMAAAWR